MCIMTSYMCVCVYIYIEREKGFHIKKNNFFGTQSFALFY